MLHSILDAMDKAGERLADFETRCDRRPAARELYAHRNQKSSTSVYAASFSPSRPSTRCSPSAIRRKIDSLHQGPRLRQRFSDCDRRCRSRTRLGGTHAPPLRAQHRHRRGRHRVFCLDRLASPAASACTMPMAPSPRSAATARAASPPGWRDDRTQSRAMSLRIETDAGLRVCRINECHR